MPCLYLSLEGKNLGFRVCLEKSGRAHGSTPKPGFRAFPKVEVALVAKDNKPCNVTLHSSDCKRWEGRNLNGS